MSTAIVRSVAGNLASVGIRRIAPPAPVDAIGSDVAGPSDDRLRELGIERAALTPAGMLPLRTAQAAELAHVQRSMTTHPRHAAIGAGMLQRPVQRRRRGMQSVADEPDAHGLHLSTLELRAVSPLPLSPAQQHGHPGREDSPAPPPSSKERLALLVGLLQEGAARPPTASHALPGHSSKPLQEKERAAALFDHMHNPQLARAISQRMPKTAFASLTHQTGSTRGPASMPTAPSAPGPTKHPQPLRERFLSFLKYSTSLMQARSPGQSSSLARQMAYLRQIPSVLSGRASIHNHWLSVDRKLCGFLPSLVASMHPGRRGPAASGQHGAVIV